MGWGTRIAVVGSKIAAICCDPLKPDFSKPRTRDIWIRTRGLRGPLPVNLKGWILVLAIFAAWLTLGACILMKLPDEVMLAAGGVFVLCGLVAAPHTAREGE